MTDLAELQSLVTRMESLLAVAAPRAATDVDGYPGNVAAGELIESTWGNATANKLRIAPRGYAGIARLTAPAGGYGVTEYIVPGLVFTAPAAANRRYRLAYNLRVVVTTAPAIGSWVYFGLRTGNTVGGTLLESMFHTLDAGVGGATQGTNMGNEYEPRYIAPGTQVCVTTSSSAGVYSINGGYLTLTDVGATA